MKHKLQPRGPDSKPDEFSIQLSSTPPIEMQLAATKRADGEPWKRVTDGKSYLTWCSYSEVDPFNMPPQDFFVMFEETLKGRVLTVGLYKRSSDQTNPNERYFFAGLNLDTGEWVEDTRVKSGKVSKKTHIGEGDKVLFGKIAAALIANVKEESGCVPRIDYLGRIPLAKYADEAFTQFLAKAREVLSHEKPVVDVEATKVSPSQLPPSKGV